MSNTPLTPPDASPRPCDCGCGLDFTPRKPWQRFIDGSHRDSYWANLRETAKKLNSSR